MEKTILALVWRRFWWDRVVWREADIKGQIRNPCRV